MPGGGRIVWAPPLIVSVTLVVVPVFSLHRSRFLFSFFFFLFSTILVQPRLTFRSKSVSFHETGKVFWDSNFPHVRHHALDIAVPSPSRTCIEAYLEKTWKGEQTIHVFSTFITRQHFPKEFDPSRNK